jgi:uncharacterized membrane protein (DUF485 family)
MDSPSQDDLTAVSGGPTDVAPLGRAEPKPAHELTAAEEAGVIPWSAIAAMPDFKSLVEKKHRFIVPATIFFVIYYLLLPVLVSYCPGLMKTEVFGHVNIAYVFGLSQFFMAWILAAIYVKTAAGWDRLAADIIAKAPKR